MEIFAEIVQPPTIFAKKIIIDVWLSSEYISMSNSKPIKLALIRPVFCIEAIVKLNWNKVCKQKTQQQQKKSQANAAENNPNQTKPSQNQLKFIKLT